MMAELATVAEWTMCWLWFRRYQAQIWSISTPLLRLFLSQGFISVGGAKTSPSRSDGAYAEGGPVICDVNAFRGMDRVVLLIDSLLFRIESRAFRLEDNALITEVNRVGWVFVFAANLKGSLAKVKKSGEGSTAAV
ncbi:hypothetical protein EVAR_569_1 [Eumeta japonica]|uniref:Uncharacterized protein n=1 Tax=Eumeta variegata TaxID=151549 RepID=A0A4C1SB46_EUMVA|nr:hypothetical protein EVAR_569_1 [Eumeta japonica]